MSSIAITLEMMLAMLLAAALLVGLKLERRLKGLREDQAGFGKAVAELNSAVARAEGGLAELKSATLTAQTTLADHMQDAKAAAAKLQQQTAKAADVIERLETALARAPAPTPQSPVKAPAVEPDVLSLTTPIRDIRDRLALSRRPAPEAPRSRADLLQSRLPDNNLERRSRVRVDDDLFEAPEPSLKLAAGGRR